MLNSNLLLEAKELIATNSTPDYGTQEIVELINKILQGMGATIKTQKFDVRGVECHNVLAKFGPDFDGGLLLSSSIETVEPGDPYLWKITDYDPYNMVVRGDNIYGLGTSSGKLDWLCMVEAARSISNKKFRRPFYILATSGEHYGLVGAKIFTESRIVRPGYGIVGGPTKLRINYSAKGYIGFTFMLKDTVSRDPKAGKSLFRLMVNGKPAHSSVPSLGENAIEKALSIISDNNRISDNIDVVSIYGGDHINKVPDRCSIDILGSLDTAKRLSQKDIQIEQITRIIAGSSLNNLLNAVLYIYNSFRNVVAQLKPQSNEDFYPPQIVYNLGIIHIVADKLIVGFDIRLLPDNDHNILLKWLEKTIDEIENLFTGIECEAELEFNAQPMMVNRTSDIITLSMNTLRDIKEEPVLTTAPFLSEALIFNQAGIESIIFGSGSLEEGIYQPDESNSLTRLNKAIEFYREIIKKFCM
ncbi:MAG: M20/M25/M40 family metallo-hydrolase [Deltaproteobacteria bacterium]|nr:M20/M25/M40 family metallo-hydrolase [Deltaproteobacteria bacterium]